MAAEKAAATAKCLRAMNDSPLVKYQYLVVSPLSLLAEKIEYSPTFGQITDLDPSAELSKNSISCGVFVASRRRVAW
jgi:hypothetical protein